jgi:S1-C subfamily serine protease
VVGVNSQILSASGSSSGVGFAIPSNLVQRVAQALIQDGYVNYSFVGLTGGDVNLSLIEALNIPNDTQGVVVMAVEPGGPAARAGLQDADDFVDVDGLQAPETVDIITSINGESLRGMSDLVSYLAAETQPGDTINLNILRNGVDEVSFNLTLTPRR